MTEGPGGCFECIDSYYHNGSYCLSCDSKCLKCKYNSTHCTTCPANKYLRGVNCVDHCESGEYFDN